LYLVDGARRWQGVEAAANGGPETKTDDTRDEARKTEWPDHGLTIGKVKTCPGKTRSPALTVSKFADSLPIHIPVKVVHGKGAGEEER
jgi:hypothetical protein